MFAKQIEPPENNQIQYPFTCSRCGKPSQTFIMCEKCFDKTDPANKRDNLPWHESPRPKTARGRAHARKQQSLQAKNLLSFTELVGHFFNSETDGAPGYMERWLQEVAKFAEGEKRRFARMEWLEQNWRRLIDVERWRKSLVEQDAEWRMTLFNRGVLESPYVEAGQDIVVESENWPSTPIGQFERIAKELGLEFLAGEVGGTTQEAYILANDKRTESELRQESRNRFFTAVYELSEKDFNLLKVRVHQLRVIRDHNNQDFYTSAEAAKLLTKMTGRMVTEDAYRKRLERFNKKFPFDPEVWVKWRYL